MWRYEAIDMRDPSRPVRRTGEVEGATAAEARSALRSVGLLVTGIREDRPAGARAAGIAGSMASSARRAVRLATRRPKPTHGQRDHATPASGGAWGVLRGRRVQERADAFDALATLVASGVPLVDAVETLASVHDGRSRSMRRTLLSVREDLRAGRPLSAALAPHRGWFDPSEVAMIEAAEVAGTLGATLAEIAGRQTRSAAVLQKLVGALAYPAAVSLVGAAVALFLATNTLPQLASILKGAKLDVPPLTSALMAAGAFVTSWWPVIVGVLGAAAAALWLGGPALLRAAGPVWRRRADRLIPLAARRLAVARGFARIADLLRSGVPLVQALRTVAPGSTGPASGLKEVLLASARRVEEGDDLSAALRSCDDGTWFDAESVRLVAVGEAGGELAPVLQRLGDRYERQTERLVDRLASVLEPAAVIGLAAAVGTVVMAAILPLLRLQEIL